MVPQLQVVRRQSIEIPEIHCPRYLGARWHGMERCPSCWFHRERSCRDGSSTDGLWSSTDGPGNTGAGCAEDNRDSTVCISWRIFDIQTSESLGTASVRRATPAEIVKVIEIAAPLPSASVTASARVEP